MSHPLERRTIEFGAPARRCWGIEPDLVFLNHGSFGAVPLELLETASRLRRELERNPVEGVWREGFPGIRDAVNAAAAFLGSEPSRTGFVVNATAGINAMMQSLDMSPGDEVLHLDQGYNAVWQTLLETGRRRGIVPRRIELPLPLTSAADAVAAIEQAITPKTRWLVLDQITSPTAIVLPVREIVAMAASHGVDTIVDGAHAPGMIEQAATEGGAAAAWTGNLHKWPCALRGAAVLVAREDVAARMRPPVVSHHLDQSFAAEFDWQGTMDPTPWLLVPEALAFMDRFGGWDRVRDRNRTLAIDWHARYCERFAVEPLTPLDGSMIGFMATVALPSSLQPDAGGPPIVSSNATPGPDGRARIGFDEVHRRLFEAHRIEVPIVVHDGRRHVRFSVHAYNEESEYERLGDAIMALCESGSA